MNWDSLDAVSTAHLVRQGEVTAAECVAAALQCMDQRNPAINAVVQRFDDHARAQARQGTAPAGDLLLGVPLLLKDSVPYNGFAHTDGSRWFAQRKATDTAPWVQAMLDQGAICVGKTNTPEFGLMDVTEPLLHGPTLNPWNAAVTTGGSSGGAAAAVASGMVAVAHGTDGGGSIRFPAACCGVFGFKPSRGLTTAVGPGMDPRLSSGAVTHVLTRSVRDSALFLAIAQCAQAQTPDHAQRNWTRSGLAQRRLRIAVIDTPTHGGALAPEHHIALYDAIALLQAMGHQVYPARWPGDPVRHHQSFFMRWAVGAFRYWQSIPQEQRSLFLDSVEPLTRSLVQLGSQVDSATAACLVQDALELESLMDGFFDTADILLTPVSACHPLRLGQHQPQAEFDTVWRDMCNNVAFTYVQNVTGQPAMSVPLHWSAKGLPVGVQFSARLKQDGLLLQLAYDLEQARPWQQRRPPLTPPRELP